MSVSNHEPPTVPPQPRSTFPPDVVLVPREDLGYISDQYLVEAEFRDKVNSVDVYRFSMSMGSLQITLPRVGAKGRLKLIRDSNRNGRLDAGEIIAASLPNRGADQVIAIDGLGDGIYYLQVEQRDPQFRAYTAIISVTPGIRATGQSPNDTQQTAIGLDNAGQINLNVTRSLFGDLHSSFSKRTFWRFKLSTHSRFWAILHRFSADLTMKLLDTPGRTILVSERRRNQPEVDKQDFMSKDLLPPGIYFVEVSFKSNTEAITPYQLELSATPPARLSHWEPLGGVIDRSPALCSWSPGRRDVFARGVDNTLWHKWFSGGRWFDWESLGGDLTSSPGAVSSEYGVINVFARGTGRTLRHRWYRSKWSQWESLGGELTSGPDVSSWGPGRLDVFARGHDNALWHRWFDQGRWYRWESLGGAIASKPAAVSSQYGVINVFARGRDHALWHKWFGGGRWSNWESLGGELTSAPTVSSWGKGRLDVFARGRDNTLIHHWFDQGRWSSWVTVADDLASAPAAVSPTQGVIHVCMRGPDSALWHKWYDGSWKP